ncbi:hypothetical protein GJ496_009842 [Pomphorhynchus laevis]|nr:hypothetical protein GJ496_009842 [Pomphorhynchus laevis]
MDELIEELSTFGILIQNSAISQCQSMLDRYNPQLVLNNIVADSIKQNTTSISTAILEDVDKQLKAKLQKLQRRQADSNVRKAQISTPIKESKLNLDNGNIESFKKLLILNDHVKLDSNSQTDIEVFINDIGRMYMKVNCHRRSAAIDQAITDMEDRFLSQSKDHIIHDIRFKYREPVYVCGQLYYNQGYDDIGPLYMRSSLRSSSAKSIEISLDDCKDYSVFPGQIVVAYGRNFEDRRFKVKEFCKIKPSVLFSMKHVIHDTHMIIACGPYLVLNDRDTFSSLKSLLTYAIYVQPSSLILIGPFIDDNINPNDGCFNMIMSEFVALLNQAYDNGLTSKIILVPSFDDVNCDCVYPHPPLTFQNSENIVSITDPAQFKINDIFINTTSVDILLHLKKHCTFSKSISDIDMISAFVNHLFTQRSFYPLFPSESNVPLDLSKLQELEMFEMLPNVLILPSDLPQFLQLYSHDESNSTLVINPGRISSRNSSTVNSFAHVGYCVKDQCFFGNILQIPRDNINC